MKAVNDRGVRLWKAIEQALGIETRKRAPFDFAMSG